MTVNYIKWPRGREGDQGLKREAVLWLLSFRGDSKVDLFSLSLLYAVYLGLCSSGQHNKKLCKLNQGLWEREILGGGLKGDV